MDSAEYIKLCQTTKSPLFFRPLNIQTGSESGLTVDTTHAIIGIATEVGELWEWNTKPTGNDIINLQEELGDMLWYIAIYAHDRNIPFFTLLPAANEVTYTSIMNCSIHAAALLDLAKKSMFYNKPFEYVKADILFSSILQTVVNMANRWEFSIEQLMEQNIAKLRKRFPEKFTEHHANNRDLVEERSELEKHR